MTILITGSSGKTASRLVALLKPTHQILIASRSGQNVDGSPAVKFDWTDPATYATPYSHPQAQRDPIKAIYLVSQPGNTRPFDIMKPFIDVARAHGVERFVLLSAIREDKTTPGTGKVHAYLQGLGVEWAVLRPTWFMGRLCIVTGRPKIHFVAENFSEQQHLPTIRDKSSIFSAAGDGKISFVSVEDIAAVAHRALTDARSPNRDYVIVGPELLSHDEVAALFTEILGREVRHIRISEEELVEGFMKFGMPESYARRLSDGESRASRDEFAILNDTVTQVTDRGPLRLREYIDKHKNSW